MELELLQNIAHWLHQNWKSRFKSYSRTTRPSLPLSSVLISSSRKTKVMR